MGQHILILGTGSAGKRHATNLASLGCRISCMDPRQDRLDEIRKEIDLVGAFTSAEDGLNSPEKIDGVAVNSPPVFHVEQSNAALERGLPVLLEKPVSPTETSAKQLEETVKRTEIGLTRIFVLLLISYREGHFAQLL